MSMVGLALFVGMEVDVRSSRDRFSQSLSLPPAVVADKLPMPSSLSGGSALALTDTKLKRLLDLPAGWDGDTAPAPDSAALLWADRILETARSLDLGDPQVAPCADGGVTLLFGTAKALIVIDLYNSGVIVMAKSRGPGQTETLEFVADDRSVSEIVSDARGFIS